MKIGSSPVIPSLICRETPLDGMRMGLVVGIIDSDASMYVNYLVQTVEGAKYCTQMDIRRRHNRNALMRMALESGRPVMVVGGINSYLRSSAVGTDGHGVVK
ncbi:hypothetical protein [Caballeronia ptereochthonis]|uniref:Uncharacterized protein n=1 Tax=Caballeronia ptereochthonis TaxID=1777144 RepID=A0A158DS63_9BURK|nr:hypothetical protein [Caballeronia ptereochthonis]SAK97415.1 hypothetical protein AWB83_05815 [Caballeronia ptereochthonis]